ncbi:hypothetical protein [Roseimicrobium sp. ORNL1]|uniref:hypothetical protein n=1 Tax=Roseimicrobium sp. ORNL1 TaxID=2711231 RepID=UPI0013E0EAEB|nr:hypothetical protein [Roseimicrobium sp. ORNL1]QIF01958.1 hypothetical protein G5S37_10595 [Roseimicrobium sp. ORNL1]
MLRPGWDGGRGGDRLFLVPGDCGALPASHPGRKSVWYVDPVVAVAEAPYTTGYHPASLRDELPKLNLNWL